MLRCPGEGCDIWDAAAGDYEQKSIVCRDCLQCGGNPPKPDANAMTADDEIDDVFLQRIENLYYEQLAGKKVSPANLTTEVWIGLVAWHAAEKQYERGSAVNLESLIQLIRQQQQQR